MGLLEELPGALIMAPMTRGTDLPFRRLLVEQGATICLGEMAYAHKIVRDARSEQALMRRHPDERCFGVQLAGKHPEVMAEAARIAVDHGADFIDVNMGCPIDDTTKRGFGAALLQRPGKVGRLVGAMRAAVQVPISVKLRLGWSAEKPTFLKVAKAAVEAGADVVALHARSRAQRYRRAADWERVRELVETVPVPVVGNGDIMDWRDAKSRLEASGATAVMVGRWGLARPWIFAEYAAQQDRDLDAAARLALLRRYVALCLEHFGDDDKGRARTRQFFGFHQDFFRRYRRRARRDGVNSDDPRDWGEAPTDELERWLCRADLEAVERLADWLVDGREVDPPSAPAADAIRAVKSPAYG